MFGVQGHVAGVPIEELVAQLAPLGVALLVAVRLTRERVLKSLRRTPTDARTPTRKEP